MPDQLLTVTQAAKKLDVPAERLRKMALAAQLGVSRGAGRQFRQRDLLALADLVAKQCWLAVVSPQNWELLVKERLAFTVFPLSRDALTRSMRPGNRIAFYITQRCTVAATAEVAAPRIHKAVLWNGNVFPYRVPLRKAVILPQPNEVDFRPLVDKLALVRSKDAWEGSVRAALRTIEQDDMRLLCSAIAKNASRTDSRTSAFTAS